MPSRLKSLELQGYKTFASRTVFEFAGAITAIVGPNGSGKSNIADSLRWVLGEQSYSLLRAKKTEDMIFSGSDSRSRAGMASATILFDNFDGWLPIDFSEVAITRRAYRDGQNEYRINGQKVRLKDVSELLAQSGLAERTYTIIGQGLVDAALALKAEERRRLFEEAAGIGLHRARREEALNRLDTTRRNLDRVLDILAELEPRLRSLERQARRAQEYDQIKADLRNVLREWYGYHWHLAQKELNEAREFSQRQETSLEKARQEDQKIEEQLAIVRNRAHSLRASLNSWHRQLAQLHSSREGLSRDLAVAEERMRFLQEQEAAARAEIARLDEDLSLGQERLEAEAQEVSRRESELEEARAQGNSARQGLARRQQDRQKAEEALQQERQLVSALSARREQQQVRLTERQAQIERSQKALSASREASDRSEHDHRQLSARLQIAEQALNQAEAERHHLEQSLEGKRSQILETDDLRKKAQDKFSAAAAEATGWKTQLDVLDQAEAALTGYSGGTRLLLEAARKAKIEGTRGALSSFLDLPAELEAAIAAALGEYLDSILIDSEPDLALDLLAKESSRGVLLPLRALKPVTPLDLPAQEGVVGVAADLVTAPAELRPVLDLLLGQVIVVRDRRSARRVLDATRANTNPWIRAVTLQGEVFLSSGPVTAGSRGASEQNLLSRQRQRREIAQRLVEIENRKVELDEQVRQIESQVNAVKLEERDLVKELQASRQQVEKESQATARARSAAEQAARQADWQKSRAAQAEAEIKQLHIETASLSEDLKKLEIELAQARDRARQSSVALAGLSMEELQADVNHWNLQLALAERALADSRQRHSEHMEAIDQVRKNQVSLQDRMQSLVAGQAELVNAKVSQRQEEERISTQIGDLQTHILPAEEELQKVEDELSAGQTAETAARQSLSFAEHNFAQARINLVRRQEALDSLQRRIEDDFGLVAFEYQASISGQTPLPLEGMVEQLPRVVELRPEVEETLKRQRALLRRIGPVNPEAQAEYLEVKQRHAFLKEQVSDLEKAEVDVRQVISELEELMQREFLRTFEAVADEFKEIFTRLFGGGSARLVLSEPDDITGTGIDIEARLPGRRTQGLSLLSGGERSLTATALVFALLKVSPTPFCVLDEVDAMLDEMNVGRFRELLRELSETTQFVVVTHNRNTVQVADVIYGVTMGRDSASQVLSLKLDEVARVVDQA